MLYVVHFWVKLRVHFAVFLQIKFDNVNHNGQMLVNLMLSETMLTCHGDILRGKTMMIVIIRIFQHLRHTPFRIIR